MKCQPRTTELVPTLNSRECPSEGSCFLVSPPFRPMVKRAEITVENADTAAAAAVAPFRLCIFIFPNGARRLLLLLRRLLFADNKSVGAKSERVRPAQPTTDQPTPPWRGKGLEGGGRRREISAWSEQHAKGGEGRNLFFALVGEEWGGMTGPFITYPTDSLGGT